MTAKSSKSRNRLCWDATSQDYLRYRPGYPKSFFALLRHLGIGVEGQRILDLGAGTGALAIPFAQQGARVTAVDLSEGQLGAAREAARRKKVNIAFKAAPAEDTSLPDHSFEVISASMCWGYFDKKRIVPEVLRLLSPGGRLLVASLLWMRNSGEIGLKTDALINAFNARRGDHRDKSEVVPRWSIKCFRLQTYHQFTTDILFTRDSWRGRIRASKWIGAGLPAEKAAAFDRELQSLLERIAPLRFPIRHLVRVQVFQPK